MEEKGDNITGASIEERGNNEERDDDSTNTFETENKNKKKKKSVKLVQSNLQGNQIPTIDSNIFGHPFPTSPNYNCYIIAFQNTSPQPKYSNHHKAIVTSKTFAISKASVNESKLEANEKFNDKMHCYKKSFSILSNSRNEKDAP